MVGRAADLRRTVGRAARLRRMVGLAARLRRMVGLILFRNHYRNAVADS